MKVESREIGGLALLGTGAGTLIYAGLTRSFMKGVGGGLITALGIRLMCSNTPAKPAKPVVTPAKPVVESSSPPPSQPKRPTKLREGQIPPKEKKKKKKKKKTNPQERRSAANRPLNRAVLDDPNGPSFNRLTSKNRANLHLLKSRGPLFNELYTTKTLTISGLLGRNLQTMEPENLCLLIEYGVACGRKLHSSKEENPFFVAIERGYAKPVVLTLYSMKCDIKAIGKHGTVWHALAHAHHERNNKHWREIGESLHRLKGSLIKQKHEGKDPIEWLGSRGANGTTLEIFRSWIPERVERPWEREDKEARRRQELDRKKKEGRVEFAF